MKNRIGLFFATGLVDIFNNDRHRKISIRSKLIVQFLFGYTCILFIGNGQIVLLIGRDIGKLVTDDLLDGFCLFVIPVIKIIQRLLGILLDQRDKAYHPAVFKIEFVQNIEDARIGFKRKSFHAVWMDADHTHMPVTKHGFRTGYDITVTDIIGNRKIIINAYRKSRIGNAAVQVRKHIFTIHRFDGREAGT